MKVGCALVIHAVAQRPCELDTCGATSDHDKCHPRASIDLIGFLFGCLEVCSPATTCVCRVFSGFSAARNIFPLGVPQVAGGEGTACQDQVIMV
ncbi:MAG: hypothetical protein VX589_15810 [Myxococcota bacterium]|nr:hypothetical protein [Myxococcota bacterium]